MKNNIGNIFSVLFVFLFLVVPANAKSLRLRYLSSVYIDGQGKSLQMPQGVACRNGTFVIADSKNHRLLRYSFQNKTIEFVSETTLSKSYPLIVDINSKGDTYVLDGKTRGILHVDSGGQFIEYLALKNIPSADSITVKSFTFDNQDNMFILDILSNRVIVLGKDSKYLKQIPLPKKIGFASDLAVNSKGDVLLLDSIEAKVYTVAKDKNKFQPLTKSLTEFMNFPTHLTTDEKGFIYLVDQYGSGIILVGLDGSFMGRQAGMGWKESLLNYPSQICINEERDLFIADRNNNRLQIFSVVEK